MDANRTRSAGGIVIGDRGMIAMVKNRDGNGAWLFPKGRVEPNETDEQAARREILEETGLSNLELLDDLGTYERHPISSTGADDLSEIKEIHMYLFAAEHEAVLAPTLEIEEARWVPLKDVVVESGSVRDRAWFTTVFERIRQAIQRD